MASLAVQRKPHDDLSIAMTGLAINSRAGSVPQCSSLAEALAPLPTVFGLKLEKALAIFTENSPRGVKLVLDAPSSLLVRKMNHRGHCVNFLDEATCGRSLAQRVTYPVTMGLRPATFEYKPGDLFRGYERVSDEYPAEEGFVGFVNNGWATTGYWNVIDPAKFMAPQVFLKYQYLDILEKVAVEVEPLAELQRNKYVADSLLTLLDLDFDHTLTMPEIHSGLAQVFAFFSEDVQKIYSESGGPAFNLDQESFSSYEELQGCALHALKKVKEGAVVLTINKLVAEAQELSVTEGSSYKLMHDIFARVLGFSEKLQSVEGYQTLQMALINLLPCLQDDLREDLFCGIWSLKTGRSRAVSTEFGKEFFTQNFGSIYQGKNFVNSVSRSFLRLQRRISERAIFTVFQSSQSKLAAISNALYLVPGFQTRNTRLFFQMFHVKEDATCTTLQKKALMSGLYIRLDKKVQNAFERAVWESAGFPVGKDHGALYGRTQMMGHVLSGEVMHTRNVLNAKTHLSSQDIRTTPEYTAANPIGYEYLY